MISKLRKLILYGLFNVFFALRSKKLTEYILKHEYCPESVAFSLTYACTGKCIMCSYQIWGKDKIQNEIKLEDWKFIFDILNKKFGLKNVILYGGDPILKKTLFFELAKYIKSNGVSVSTISNGYLIDDNVAREIVKNFDSIFLSIDGIGKEHEYIRQRDGIYEKVCNAVELLLKYRKEYGSNIELSIASTLIKRNAKTIKETLEILHKRYKLPIVLNICTWNAAYWRPREGFEKDVVFDDDELIDKTMDELQNLPNKNVIVNFPASFKYYRQFLKTGKLPQIPCFNVVSSIFVEPNGDIKICQLFPPFTNYKKLREKGDEVLAPKRNNTLLKQILSGFFKECPDCSCGIDGNIHLYILRILRRFVRRKVKP